MSSAVRRTTGSRSGGRSERVVREVLAAANDELGRAGYLALRVDDVAARAGVNKTTVYRRWPTKADLVAAALRVTTGLSDSLPDTGSFRGDLIELARRALAFASKPEGRALTRLLTLERTDPEVERLVAGLRDEGRTHRGQVVQRAKVRGQIPASVDERMVVDAIFMPILVRALRCGEDVTHDEVVQLVDLVVTGLEHGGGTRLHATD